MYPFTISTLDALPLTTPGGHSKLGPAAGSGLCRPTRLSVHHACAQLEHAPFGPTVLGILASQFSDLDALEGHVNDLLARVFPTGLGKWGHHTALGVVALPYHGAVEEAHHDEGCRSKGRKRFIRSAPRQPAGAMSKAWSG